MVIDNILIKIKELFLFSNMQLRSNREGLFNKYIKKWWFQP